MARIQWGSESVLLPEELLWIGLHDRRCWLTLASYLTVAGIRQLKGVVSGVLFLCRPYFTGQFLNQSYICDVWEIVGG